MLVTGVFCAFEIKEGWPDIRDIIEVNNKTRTCINYVVLNLVALKTSQSSIEHVLVESCDDLIAKENDELKQEIGKLKNDLIKSRSMSQVQPSQDNRDNMVKKLEKGSTVTSSSSKLDQAKNHKTQEELKGSKLSSLVNPSSNKSSKQKSQATLERRQAQRICYRCKEKGHMINECKTNPSEVDSGQNRSHRVARDIIEVNNKTRTCINYVLVTAVVND